MNILYQSAGPDTTEKGPSAEYAEVSKPHKKPNKSSNDEYAEVQKQNDEYAEVDRKAQQKNVKKKKQKGNKLLSRQSRVEKKDLGLMLLAVAAASTMYKFV